MINMGDDVTPAELAELDRQDAAIRDAMRLPFGGMFNLNSDGAKLPFLDSSGAVGVVHVAGQDSDNRTCTACTDPTRHGHPDAECGRQAVLTARYDFTTEHACDNDTAAMLVALRPMMINDDGALG